MRSEPTVAYHGTPDLAKVMAEGLRADHADNSPCVWMALRPEDASPFGDVVAIDLSMLGGGPWPTDVMGQLVWQAHYKNDIPAAALTPFNRALGGDDPPAERNDS